MRKKKIIFLYREYFAANFSSFFSVSSAFLQLSNVYFLRNRSDMLEYLSVEAEKKLDLSLVSQIPH